MTNHIVRPHADFERWARGIENFPDAVRAVEGAYGQGWADCEKSHPAATAREEAIRAEAIEECARVAEGIDELAVTANWDNGDDIAHEVKKAVVDQIRRLNALRSLLAASRAKKEVS